MRSLSPRCAESAETLWPIVGFAIYLVWRWAKRSSEADEAQRRALLEAAAKPPDEPSE